MTWLKVLPELLLGLISAIKQLFKLSKTVQRKDPEQLVADNQEAIAQVKNAKTKEEKRAAARAVGKRINKL
jgi:hypothetical protein